jgi:hypothetical protein
MLKTCKIVGLSPLAVCQGGKLSTAAVSVIRHVTQQVMSLIVQPGFTIITSTALEMSFQVGPVAQGSVALPKMLFLQGEAHHEATQHVSAQPSRRCSSSSSSENFAAS